MEAEKNKGEMDRLQAVGVFSLLVLNAGTGEILERFADNNLVVTLGQTNLAKVLGGHASGKKISKIAIGTNGTTPTLADTTLTSLFSKLITSVDYPEANSVRFSWSIDGPDANGMTIREFGLLNEDGVLCARKVRADIIKTAEVRLVGSWKITIN
ncbi:hypothetical protein [Pedobacter sp.]|uniref:hypothetical protein n=1 Tax=Pedobacter sp. TaxID=1411316 RepID=UPI003D7FE60B